MSRPPTPLHLHEVLQTLRIEGTIELFAPHWEESAAAKPSVRPSFLRPDAIRDCVRLANLSDDVLPALYDTAERIASSPALLALAWHCQRLLCECPQYEADQIRQWPSLNSSLGERADAFYLLVALAAIPRIRAAHAKLGIPDDISRASCGRHYPETLWRYNQHHEGRIGVFPGSIYWVRNYVLNHLYRVGRLEYMIRPFGSHVHVYRHTPTRQVIALAADGTYFDDEGLVAADEDSSAQRATLSEGDGYISGLAIRPSGYATAAPCTLSSDEWKPVLSPGDPIFDVHIPSGGQMSLASCQQSMRHALDFFARHYPTQSPSAFACSSWILNPQLAHIYRDDSNMVLWQRELYLYPIPSGDRSGLRFIFGRDDIDIATAPRDTSLRRALLDHLQAGGRLINGGMFFLCEDFESFGSQVYQRYWRASAASLDGVGISETKEKGRE